MKYRFLKWVDRVLHRQVERCVVCGRKLTVEEAYYYDCRCEKCEEKIANDLLMK
ncbi:hypothetical protein [Cellulosilyticum lentocellum]|uniref:hypothetical protein n=1 Tax=Cellulosilyticum lentocellum TaxID=29360 RepID=UPI0002D3C9AF|nr:hypothetical protein [Cellulosilyticum lentocellum]